MRGIFLGDPAKGIVPIVAIPTSADLCLMGPSPSVLFFGIRIDYDAADESSAAALALMKGMSRGGKIPRVFAWEENNRAEVAILFSYDDPPESLWRPIMGAEGLAFTGCIKIYATCEPDYPMDVWKESKNKSAPDRPFILQILSSGKPWTQFSVPAVENGNPSKSPEFKAE